MHVVSLPFILSITLEPITSVHLWQHAAKANVDAEADNYKFLHWAQHNICPDAVYMNISSLNQCRHVFLGSVMPWVKMNSSAQLKVLPIKVTADEPFEVPWLVAEDMIKAGQAVLVTGYRLQVTYLASTTPDTNAEAEMPVYPLSCYSRHHERGAGHRSVLYSS